MSVYDTAVVQMSKMLRNLDAWLDKAVAFAELRGFSADSFLAYRLAPDMHPFSTQVQTSCDGLKFAAARLAGVEPPSHPDTESTMAELKQRIAATLAFVDELRPEQFEGAESRELTLSFIPGKAIRGDDYLREMALPNFYFHVTTAYALLRQSGVDVGKVAFIGSLNLYDPPA